MYIFVKRLHCIHLKSFQDKKKYFFLSFALRFRSIFRPFHYFCVVCMCFFVIFNVLAFFIDTKIKHRTTEITSDTNEWRRKKSYCGNVYRVIELVFFSPCDCLCVCLTSNDISTFGSCWIAERVVRCRNWRRNTPYSKRWLLECASRQNAFVILNRIRKNNNN